MKVSYTIKVILVTLPKVLIIALFLTLAMTNCSQEVPENSELVQEEHRLVDTVWVCEDSYTGHMEVQFEFKEEDAVIYNGNKTYHMEASYDGDELLLTGDKTISAKVDLVSDHVMKVSDKGHDRTKTCIEVPHVLNGTELQDVNCRLSCNIVVMTIEQGVDPVPEDLDVLYETCHMGCTNANRDVRYWFRCVGHAGGVYGLEQCTGDDWEYYDLPSSMRETQNMMSRYIASSR